MADRIHYTMSDDQLHPERFGDVHDFSEIESLKAENGSLARAYEDAQSQITDLHALAESNTATIDRLLAEVQALRELADTQAAIIAAKNAEIAQMRGDYADALEADAETTLYQKHFRPAIEQALADDDLTALGVLEAAAIAAEYDDEAGMMLAASQGAQ